MKERVHVSERGRTVAKDCFGLTKEKTREEATQDKKESILWLFNQGICMDMGPLHKTMLLLQTRFLNNKKIGPSHKKTKRRRKMNFLRKKIN